MLIRFWCISLNRWRYYGTFFPNLRIRISLVLMHRIAPNLVNNIHTLRKYVDLTLVLIGWHVAQVCHIFLEFRIIYNLIHLAVWHIFASNLIGKILMMKKYVYLIFMHIDRQMALQVAFLLFSTCTRRKHWICENFRLPVFVPFARFEMSWTRFDHLYKCLSVYQTVSLSVCMSSKFCGHCISRTREQKLMKLYIHCLLYVIWSWLGFGINH